MTDAVRYVALAALLLLTGCAPPTNDDRIREFKKCEAAGMLSVPNMGGGISCYPPSEAK